MKTAISLPDPLFQLGEQFAKEYGLSRSELYATALEDYLKKWDANNITEALNELYSTEDSSLDEILSQLQAQSLPQESW